LVVAVMEERLDQLEVLAKIIPAVALAEVLIILDLEVQVVPA
jgi:hypothetical protein